jgi:hypothetical protein
LLWCIVGRRSAEFDWIASRCSLLATCDSMAARPGRAAAHRRHHAGAVQRWLRDELEAVAAGLPTA